MWAMQDPLLDTTFTLPETSKHIKYVPDNLCEKLEKQTRSIYGLIGMVGTALVSFFFYAVQQGIFH